MFLSLQTEELQKTKPPVDNIVFSVVNSLLETVSSCGHQLSGHVASGHDKLGDEHVI